MVEVFKTTVKHENQAQDILFNLKRLGYNKVNFDLEDCDNILRVERNKVDTMEVISTLKYLGVKCEILEDIINEPTTFSLSYESNRFLIYVFFIITCLFSSIGIAQFQSNWPQTTTSEDGTMISYEVHGEGEVVLVFIHGWSCDSRYWKNQVSTFSKSYKVVLVDLAGHGHSGTTRETYSMKAFGEDVLAVVEKTGINNIILIGHSMGGAVIAQAALLMPEKVKGLIAVDAYHNIEYPLTQEQFDMMVAPMRNDFRSGTQQFVLQMFNTNADAITREWILADMSSASSVVALSAMEELMSHSIDGSAAKIFEDIQVPIMAVNGDKWSIDSEANRRHMKSFEPIVVEDSDHFLMVNKSEPFNKALMKAIKTIEEKD